MADALSEKPTYEDILPQYVYNSEFMRGKIFDLAGKFAALYLYEYNNNYLLSDQLSKDLVDSLLQNTMGSCVWCKIEREIKSIISCDKAKKDDQNECNPIPLDHNQDCLNGNATCEAEFKKGYAFVKLLLNFNEFMIYKSDGKEGARVPARFGSFISELQTIITGRGLFYLDKEWGLEKETKVNP